MKIKLLFWIIMLMLFIIGAEQTTAAESNMIKRIVQDNTAFALDLYGQLKTAKGNLFFLAV